MNKYKTCGQEIPEIIKQSIPAKELEWGAVSDKEMNWEEAKKWCETQGEGWRLPTRAELIQAFDECILPGSDNDFWSSTEVYDGPANAWYVNLSYGYMGNASKSSGVYVRSCRNV